MTDRTSPIEGAILGAFAGFIVSEIGLASLLGPAGTLFRPLPLAVAGAIAGAAGLKRVLLAVDVSLIMLWTVLGYTPLADALASGWVRDDRRAEPRHVDAVVALSSGVSADSVLDVYGVDRLLSALEVMKRGGASRLVTITVSTPHRGVSLSSEPDQRRLIDMAGQIGAWTAVQGAGSTHDEARLTARALSAAPGSSIIVVTSPIHTRRACATFEGAGFRVYCHPAREHEFMSWHPETTRDRLATIRAYVYERLGMIKYRSAGWIR